MVVPAAHREREAIAGGITMQVGQISMSSSGFTGSQFLNCIMGMPRPIRQALLRVELAMRGAQPRGRPACADRSSRGRSPRCRRARKRAARGRHRHRRVGRKIGFAATGPVMLHRLLQRDREEQPLALRLILDLSGSAGLAAIEAHPAGVEVEARPARALERPFVLVAHDELLAGGAPWARRAAASPSRCRRP